MSNWGYVMLAYGVTYFVLAAYAVYLFRGRARAERALADEQYRKG